jgi:uncharacterized protein YbbC (DUF1343 family)
MPGQVLTGLDRLLDEGPGVAGLASGVRIGLVAHPASVDRHLRHAVDILAARDDLHLVRLFAPEHGLRGEAQDMETVDDLVDPASGLPVRSLYGADPSTLTPRRDDVDDLDAVVVDLQDVGARYYTFVYTLAHVLEACAGAGIPTVVLDRPNPIGGRDVEGPVLDPAYASFVGRYPIPVRHGMTALELAGLFRDVYGVPGDLRGVAMVGWHRGTWFDATGLPWVAPSPNMPSLDTATVYPGGCLVEGTNLSEARGTTRPFEQFGAPWVDGPALRDALSDHDLPGATFRDVAFRPGFQKHAGRTCAGVFVHVVDRASFRPFRTYLAALIEARRQDPGAFAWRTEAYEFETDRLAIDLLLGRRGLREAIEAAADPVDLERTWSDDVATFASERRRHLLYPD